MNFKKAYYKISGFQQHLNNRPQTAISKVRLIGNQCQNQSQSVSQKRVIKINSPMRSSQEKERLYEDNINLKVNMNYLRDENHIIKGRQFHLEV